MFIDTTTGDRLTKVRNPMAVDRFNLDDRVTWDGLDIGTVISYVDDCTVMVRWSDSTATMAPSFSARLKRVPKEIEPDLIFDTLPDMKPAWLQDYILER